MKRKEFIRNIAGGVVIPSVLNGWSVRAFAENPLPEGFQGLNTVDNDRILVLVQMAGGNDGLNTVIPLDAYDTLANLRSKVILPKNSLLKLDGRSQNALHPAMTGLRSLYNGGKVRVVQNVSYPTSSLSHFRSTDVIQSASDADTVVTTGWLGRYLSNQNPTYPTNYPNTKNPAPLALEVNNASSLTLQGPLMGMGVLTGNPDSFFQLLNNTPADAPDTRVGEQLRYIRSITKLANSYGSVLQDRYAAGGNTPSVTYPGSSLGQALKAIAKLISGGLETRIYVVTQKGYDTHIDQVDRNNHAVGYHADLLRDLSDSISAFSTDISGLGHGERVLGMTMSEFGRRIVSNAGDGTDHGIGAPMFFFGEPVESGFLGANPIISPTTTVDDNIAMEFDYRQLYSSVLQQWFCATPTEASEVLFGEHAPVSILKTSAQCPAAPKPPYLGDPLLSAAPSPFRDSTNIHFEVVDERMPVIITVYNTAGQQIDMILNSMYTKGSNSVRWNASTDLPAGLYYIHLQNGSVNASKGVIKI